MKFIAQLHPFTSLCAPREPWPIVTDVKPLVEYDDWVWAVGLGQSFGRSGSPLVVGPLDPAEATGGATMTVDVTAATVSAIRRNRV